MPGIGIISNPHSKLNKRSPAEASRLKALIGQKGVFTSTQDLEHLDATISAYRDTAISILAIVGGDGTISQTIGRIIRIYGSRPLPHIAVLRGGTMNVIASHLGVKGQPAEILLRLIQTVEQGYPLSLTTVTTMKIGEVYGFLYADQSSTSILKEFYRKKNGRIGASLLTMRLIHSFLSGSPLIKKIIQSQKLKAHFRPEGHFESSVLGCFAGTISKMPLGLPMLAQANSKPGHFQATMITCKAEKLLWYLPLIMLQQKEGPSIGKHSVYCQSAFLQYEGSVDYTVDGEIYHSPQGLIEIEAGPKISFVRL